MEKRKQSIDTKKRAQSTEATSDEAEYKSCVNSLRSLIKEPSFAKHRKALEDVTKVFDKVWDSWKKSQTKRQRLELEIASNVSKIKAALQLSVEDKSTIDTLKEELEKAWRIADEMRSSATTMKRQSSFPDLGAIQTPISRTDPVQSQLEKQAKTIEDLRGCKVKLEMSLKDVSSALKEKVDRVQQLESQLKALEEQIGNSSGTEEERYGMMVEIENNRLRVFELEEEIATKDKSIEDLMKENESKVKDLGEKDAEICSLKACTKVSVATMTDSVGNIHQDELKNLEAQVRKRILKDKKSRIEIINLEEKLADKLKLLNEAEGQIKHLTIEILGKSEACQDLMYERDELKEKLEKSKSTIRELEVARDRGVNTVGSLELQVFELTKKHLEYKCSRYAKSVKCMNKMNDAMSKRIEEEEEKWSKYKKLWKEELAEKDKRTNILSNIVKQVQAASTLVDTYMEQNGDLSLWMSDPEVFRMPLCDDKSVTDLSLINSFVSCQMEFCKALMAENQSLKADIYISKPVDVNEDANSDIDQLCGPRDSEFSGQDEVMEIVEESAMEKKQSRRNTDASEKEESIVKKTASTEQVKQTPTDEDQSGKTDENQEARELPKNPVLIRNPVIRQKPRKKSAELLSSPEWKKFKDQVKLKTRRLNVMEANVEALNSQRSIRQPLSAAEKPRVKRKTSSVQSLTLENIKKSLRKQ